MPEFPPPIRLPGEPELPREPYAGEADREQPTVRDEAADTFGAADAAALLAERLGHVRARPPEFTVHGLLWSPFCGRDRVDGFISGDG